MSNLYRNQELYNKYLKYKFLQESTNCEDIEKQKKGTVIYYKYIFQISFNMESRLNKDVYNFNDHELHSLINSYRNGSLTSAQSVKSVLTQYLDYCVCHGYIEVNLLQDLSGYDDLIQFIDKTAQKQKYINREQFEELIDKAVNFQDKFPIAMAYYGFKGEKNCEIINLRNTDVDQNNGKIYIKNRGKTYKIDEYLMDIIVNAMKEEEYRKRIITQNNKIDDFCEIHPNDYVMRISSKKINEPVKPITVISRFNRIREEFGNDYLTITSVCNSGMLEKLKKVYAQKGELHKEDWIDIGESYGHQKINWSKNRQKFQNLLNKNKSYE